MKIKKILCGILSADEEADSKAGASVGAAANAKGDGFYMAPVSSDKYDTARPASCTGMTAGKNREFSFCGKSKQL